MNLIIKRPTARIDIETCALNIGRFRADSAEQFLEATEATLQRLAGQPGLGEPYTSTDPDFASVRRSRISRFKNFLIYYRPIEGGIEVLRVVHGARDQSKILDPDDG